MGSFSWPGLALLGCLYFRRPHIFDLTVRIWPSFVKLEPDSELPFAFCSPKISGGAPPTRATRPLAGIAKRQPETKCSQARGAPQNATQQVLPGMNFFRAIRVLRSARPWMISPHKDEDNYFPLQSPQKWVPLNKDIP